MSDAPRRRIKELEVMVAAVRAETPDTTTLVLFTGNDRLDYKAGHFLTIDPHQFQALDRFIAHFEDLKGKKEPARAYSLASAPHEKYLAITVKEERYQSGVTKYPPLLSPLLVRQIPKGSHFVVTGFTGPYTLDEDIESKTDHVVHLCAGSGSVPNFSMLKYALHHHPKVRHTFVYSNKTWSDVIFRHELEQLAAEHPERLRLVHTLTREDPSRHGHARCGRIEPGLLRELIPDPSACLVYACGPGITPHERVEAKKSGTPAAPRFLEAVLEGLRHAGVPEERVNYESYG